MPILDNTSRASFDIRHAKYGTSKSSNTRQARLIKEEAHRELLSDERQQHFYQKNKDCIPELAHKNMAFVNDGEGNFKRAESIDEMIEYRESRLAKLSRKPKADQTIDSNFVIHFPKSMLKKKTIMREINGKQVPHEINVIDAKDEDEERRIAIQFTKDVVDFISLTRDAYGLHDMNINLNETTPHIQIHGDTFLPDPKNPDKLRVGYSDMWGTSRGGGKRGPEKLSDFHKDFRKYLVSKGYDVALESSPRSKEHLAEKHYKAIASEQKAIEKAKKQIIAEKEQIDFDKRVTSGMRKELNEEKSKLKDEYSYIEMKEEEIENQENVLNYERDLAQKQYDRYKELYSKTDKIINSGRDEIVDDILKNADWLKDSVKKRITEQDNELYEKVKSVAKKETGMKALNVRYETKEKLKELEDDGLDR